jgi:outer membrane protein assembly factor BamA
MQYGRFGSRAEKGMLNPLYLGYPWFLRGYDNNKMYDEMTIDEINYVANQLYGSKMLLGNVELRIPVTGPKRMAPIKLNSIMTELALFFDAGLAWSSGSKIGFSYNISDPMTRIPVYSIGASLRANLLGAVVIEPFYAIPFQGNGLQKGGFGINFIPGW